MASQLTLWKVWKYRENQRWGSNKTESRMRVTYMYEMYEHSINTAKVSTSFHIETKLLFKVFAKTDLYDKDLRMQ